VFFSCFKCADRDIELEPSSTWTFHYISSLQVGSGLAALVLDISSQIEEVFWGEAKWR
jgi:hypothetical protein